MRPDINDLEKLEQGDKPTKTNWVILGIIGILLASLSLTGDMWDFLFTGQFNMVDGRREPQLYLTGVTGVFIAWRQTKKSALTNRYDSPSKQTLRTILVDIYIVILIFAMFFVTLFMTNQAEYWNYVIPVFWVYSSYKFITARLAL